MHDYLVYSGWHCNVIVISSCPLYTVQWNGFKNSCVIIVIQFINWTTLFLCIFYDNGVSNLRSDIFVVNNGEKVTAIKLTYLLMLCDFWLGKNVLQHLPQFFLV